MLDSTRITHTPAFVLEYDAFEKNLALIGGLQQSLGSTFLFALKGFGMHRVFGEISACAKGATASSLNEARLASEYFSHVHAYAPVYQPDEFDAISQLSSHITFNSLGQYELYKNRLGRAKAGLRVNPKLDVVATELYDPCAPGSRLGIQPDALTMLPEGITGLHVHNLCESGAKEMQATLANVEKLYGRFFGNITWLNLGGGHLVTRKGYDLALFSATVQSFRQKYPHIELMFEPGAAYVWQTGVLVSEVLDIVTSDGIDTLMMDTSFTAHMPDCLEMPYTPSVRGAVVCKDGESGVRLGGSSCLAGDWVGEYRFATMPKIGDRLVFEDMMHYTMVKTTMFNGLAHPDIGIWRDGCYEVVKQFSYEDYKNRLS